MVTNFTCVLCMHWKSSNKFPFIDARIVQLGQLLQLIWMKLLLYLDIDFRQLEPTFSEALAHYSLQLLEL